MSADLLAEFDSFYQAPNKNQSATNPASNDASFLNETRRNMRARNTTNFPQWQTPAEKPNNDFKAPALNISKPNYAGLTSPMRKAVNQDESVLTRRSTLGLSSNVHEPSNFANFEPRKSATQTTLPQRPAPITRSSYGEVLFDADDMAEAQDDDEFGDFETGTSDHVIQLPSQSITGMFGAATPEPKIIKTPGDLLSTTTPPIGGDLFHPQAPKPPSFQKRNPSTKLGIINNPVSMPKQEVMSKSTSPATTWPGYEPKCERQDLNIDPTASDDVEVEWGDFADRPGESPTTHNNTAASSMVADAWAWDALNQVSGPIALPQRAEALPPSNIPPPSVILELFPPLFDLPQSSLFKAVANQPFSLKNRIISDPSTIDFLRGYLLIATVAARIIAGRKLRWKRDILLSQAMKIGPAAAGGKGGMKLTGVDKAELTREDREATDVVRVWKAQLGRLRSAIAVANSSMHNVSAHLAIPDISDNMYVKTLDGGLVAPKPCLICGLKREERVIKVDVLVEDSFGEWWIEYWGHRACRNFWLEHEPKLKNR